jgi:hypothetical protein
VTNITLRRALIRTYFTIASTAKGDEHDPNSMAASA